MSDDEKRRQLALHESAHAVCASMLGWTVAFASIEVCSALEGEKTLGRVVATPREIRSEGDALLVALQAIQMALIGDMAVRSFGLEDPDAYGLQDAPIMDGEELWELVQENPTTPLADLTDPEPHVAASDREKAADYSRLFAQTEQETILIHELAAERCRTMLRSPVFVWQTKALAEELLERGTMLGRDVDSFLMRHLTSLLLDEFNATDAERDEIYELMDRNERDEDET